MQSRAPRSPCPSRVSGTPAATNETPTESPLATQHTREPRTAQVFMDVVYPSLEAPQVEAPAQLPHPSSDHAPATCVLIVDDNVIVRDAVRRMLTDKYDSIVDAPDLEQGARASDEFEVRILILDLILPNREVTANFREARRRFPRAKVLAITGGGRTGPTCLLTVARQLGAYAVLQKPFRRQALLDALRAAGNH